MRIASFCLLLGVLCLGCNRAEEARLRAVENNLKQIELALHNYEEKLKRPVSGPSHVILSETEYYTTGPQQGRPADGKFAAGTKVSILEEAGSYVLVRSEGGVEAYVAADEIDGIDDVSQEREAEKNDRQ